MEPVIATGNINDDAPSNRIMTRQSTVYGYSGPHWTRPSSAEYNRQRYRTVDTTVVDKAYSWMSFPRYRDGEKLFIIIPVGCGIMHFIKRYTGNL